MVDRHYLVVQLIVQVSPEDPAEQQIRIMPVALSCKLALTVICKINKPACSKLTDDDDDNDDDNDSLSA